MTASFIRDLFAYNSWANGKQLDTLATVPEELYLRDLKSSCGGLHGTMLHIVFAQQVWFLRWIGQPIDAALRTSKSSPTLASVRDAWNRIDGDTARFLSSKLSDDLLSSNFEMRNLKGDSFVHSYGDSMVHLVNHSSYHRGQVAGMIRQLGFTPPGTDYILFTRERK